MPGARSEIVARLQVAAAAALFSWVLLIHGERVGLRALLGGGLILGAAVTKNVLDLRADRGIIEGARD
ncbi:MAG TPA: hypothetical protein VFB95_13345 [Candidatus Cryosericum sp.]|nr:hypothetical protein [Candidatus Cryosericum sp.]